MTEDGFWARTAPENGCLNWTGSIDTRGYGHLRWEGRICRAHRVAYAVVNGAIPQTVCGSRSVIMHTCDNRICCNPDHLRLGTQRENMADMVAKRRQARLPGESNGRAVLTVSDVRAIRADNRGSRTIARDYPVSRAAVQRIKSGAAWSSV